jgi:hypothetical protein
MRENLEFRTELVKKNYLIIKRIYEKEKEKQGGL